MSTPAGTDSVEVTLTYDMDGGQKLATPIIVPFTISNDLAWVFGRALVINESTPPPLSFSSLLIAMMMGSDAVSTWLKSHLGSQGVTIEKIALRSSRTVDQSYVLSRSSTANLPPLGATISARRVLEQAGEIAAALGPGPVFDIRHLSAAYPVLSNWHAEDFRELGIDRLEWCRAYGAFMANSYPGEKRYWREYADRASPVPLTSFSADVYTEKDLLGIDRTVEALALLIASTRTDTPLSIGVFGQWGSGKSFFMQHLRRRIWKIAAREKNREAAWIDKRQNGKATPNDAPLYLGQIAQVEFNAWHYSEGNIVASLVDHLFRNLQVLPDPGDKELEQRRAAVILQISGAKLQVGTAAQIVEHTQTKIAEAAGQVERASREAERARSDVDAKALELDARTAEAATARSDLQSAIHGLSTSAAPDTSTVIALAMESLPDSQFARDAKNAADALGKELGDWRKFAARLFSVRGAILVAICLVPPVVSWTTTWLTHVWAAGASVLVALTATISHVIDLARAQRKEFDSKMDALEREEARRTEEKRLQLQRKLQSLQGKWNEKLAELQGSLEELRATQANQESKLDLAVRALAERTKELDLKVQERAAAEEKLKEAKAELDQLSSTRLLDEFLKNRLQTDEYQKQLGFLALVRRDFERLSDLIARANAEWSDPAGTTGAPPLSRIVLYIDDLDRCSEQTVLKVLEVVHLLLAFRLFVCVVAVDPRWIEECLKNKHSYLFAAGQEDGSARATVGDYLEKIFQIPIWTSPIDKDQRASVVNSLLGKSAAPAPWAGTAQPSTNSPDTHLPQDQDSSGQKTGDAFQILRKKAEEVPDPLRITTQETEFIGVIASLLSDKPRALKRFVNTYRLLKASLPDVDRGQFVTADVCSPHRICLIQLALFTGQPRLAPVLVKLLQSATVVQALNKASGKDLDLETFFSALDEKTHKELRAVVRLVPDPAAIPLTKFREWLPDTSKYLFHRED